MRIENFTTYLQTKPIQAAAITTIALIVLINIRIIYKQSQVKRNYFLPPNPPRPKFRVLPTPKQPPILPQPPPRSPSPFPGDNSELPQTPVPPVSSHPDATEEYPPRKLAFATPNPSSLSETSTPSDEVKTQPDSPKHPPPNKKTKPRRHLGTPNAPTTKQSRNQVNEDKQVPALMATLDRLCPTKKQNDLVTRVLDEITQSDPSIKLSDAEQKTLKRQITFQLLEGKDEQKINNISTNLLQNSHIIKEARQRQQKKQNDILAKNVKDQLASIPSINNDLNKIRKIISELSKNGPKSEDEIVKLIKSAHELRKQLPQSTQDFDLTEEEYKTLQQISIWEIICIKAEDVTQHILNQSSVVQNAKACKADEKLKKQQNKLIEAVQSALEKPKYSNFSWLEIVEISKLIGSENPKDIVNAIVDADRIRDLIFDEFSNENLSNSDKSPINHLLHSKIIQIRNEKSDGNNFDDSVDIDQTIVDEIIDTDQKIKALDQAVQVKFLKEISGNGFTPRAATPRTASRTASSPAPKPIVPTSDQNKAFSELIKSKLQDMTPKTPRGRSRTFGEPSSPCKQKEAIVEKTPKTKRRLKRRATAIGPNTHLKRDWFTPELKRRREVLEDSPGTPGSSYESPY